jgi:hypothetical protein
MTAVAWVLVGVAALVAAAAARPARRSRLALAIAVAGTTVTLCAVIYAALGYGGCSDRGDCGAIGGLLRTVIVLGLLGLPVLLVISALAWGWNRIPRHRRIPALSRRDGMLAACGVFLIGIGLAMAATRSNGPLGGIAVMLFGGACVVVPLSTVLARRAAGAPCLGHVEQDGALLPALIVPASTVKVRLLGLGIGCFLGASLILWLAPSSLAGEGSDPGKAEFAGLFGTVVFGLAALISLATWHRRRRVALLPSGLRWEMGGRPNFAAWEDIEDVGTFALRGTRFLTIDVREGTASGAHSGSGRWRRRTGPSRAPTHRSGSTSSRSTATAWSRPSPGAVIRRRAAGRSARRRASSGWGLEPETAVAEHDEVAGADLGLDDLAAVDPRAVRGAEVAQDPAAVAQDQLGVAAGDRDVGQHDRAAAATTEHQTGVLDDVRRGQQEGAGGAPR